MTRFLTETGTFLGKLGAYVLAMIVVFWPYIFGLVIMARKEMWLEFVLSTSFFPPIAWLYGVWEILT